MYVDPLSKLRHITQNIVQHSVKRKKKRLLSQQYRRQSSTKVHRKICPICETTFQTEIPNKKYCSEDCNKKNRKIRRKLLLEKVTAFTYYGLCSVCGAEDVPVDICPECGYLCCGSCVTPIGKCKNCVTKFNAK